MTVPNKDVLQTIGDVACVACGCICDDLTLHVTGSEVNAVDLSCPRAQRFFSNASPSNAECRIDGQPATLEEATHRAATLLAEALAPLIMGLECATTETIRQAIALADRTRASIDPTDSMGRSQDHSAIQSVGVVASTLGEAANRADLVVYWFVDPAETHPRHMERFAAEAERVIVVDAARTASANQADEFVQLDEERQFEALWTLRETIRLSNKRADDSSHLPSRCNAAGSDAIVKLADRLTNARFTAFFYEPATNRLDGSEITQAIAELIRDLHTHTRAVALRLGRPGNAVGAVQALTWQTGYPGAVTFRHGYPEHLPGEAQAEKLVERGEVDAVLIVGADPLSHWPDETCTQLSSIPTIVLDDLDTETTAAAAVVIPTARFGVSQSGTVYRSDGVALPLTPILPPSAPSAEDVLAVIGAKI